MRRDVGHRRLGSGQPPQGRRSAEADGTRRRVGPVGPGLAARQPAVQRGHRADGREGRWNALHAGRRQAVLPSTSQHPELAKLLPVLYPGVFPNLAGSRRRAADLVAILLTGHPGRHRPRLPELHRPTQADLLRLNMAIPPASKPEHLGLLGGDLAGFPNGRRVIDDVVTDRAAGDRRARPTRWSTRATRPTRRPRCDRRADCGATRRYLPQFPYLGTPQSGSTAPLSAVS